ncbi:MAG: oligoribonuclease [Elusimicrobia bacterium]|nr:oligoribonuclease [Elusimicrobiota bacterium]
MTTAPLIWLDLEMTGLDPDRDTIIEIGTVVTGGDLSVIAEGPCLAVHHPPAVVKAMDPWCIQQHGQSGLTERVRISALSMAEAESQTLNFLRRHCAEQKSPLCGNSVGHDRLFLQKYMPRLYAFVHYRSVDVSSIKELVLRWYPPHMHYPQKQSKHTVLSDIRESIEELLFYRKNVFREPNSEV